MATIVSNSPTGTKRFISSALSSQILVVVKRGISSAEISILETLETLLYGSKGPGQRNALPLWASLWSLILTYRDCMVTYKLYAALHTPEMLLRKFIALINYLGRYSLVKIMTLIC